MPGKQERYRKRKSEQGFQRVEVLIPHEAAPLIKAYARALRDAHTLGLDAPLFDGMGHSMSGRPDEARAEKQLPLKKHNHNHNAQTNSPKTLAPHTQRKNDKKSSPRKRPDFSKGLLDK